MKTMRPRDVARRGPQVVRVLVELTERAADDSMLTHLRELGLEVEQVVRNKVVGSIASEKISRLEADAIVRVVERSRNLKLSDSS
ncbi:MAG TPA: hypothetical protein VEK15_20750 [Vicinamibacteria bacterium]|nr:hypothetical protein [Vicinamibacteria bacterium]